MAKIMRKLIATSFVISCASLVLCIVSLTTDFWLEATAVLTEANVKSNVNYGLFGGTLKRQQMAATLQFNIIAIDLTSRVNNDPSSTPPPLMGAGIWLSTVIFLALSCAFAACAMCFSLLNLYANPIEPVFNIFGLYIWNGAAAVCALIALTLWGFLFLMQLRQNILVTDTLRQELRFSSEGRASLAGSYFALLGAILLDAMNVILLLVRRQLMQRVLKPVLSIPVNPTTDTRLEFY